MLHTVSYNCKHYGMIPVIVITIVNNENLLFFQGENEKARDLEVAIDRKGNNVR